MGKKSSHRHPQTIWPQHSSMNSTRGGRVGRTDIPLLHSSDRENTSQVCGRTPLMLQLYSFRIALSKIRTLDSYTIFNLQITLPRNQKNSCLYRHWAINIYQGCILFIMQCSLSSKGFVASGTIHATKCCCIISFISVAPFKGFQCKFCLSLLQDKQNWMVITMQMHRVGISLYLLSREDYKKYTELWLNCNLLSPNCRDKCYT